MYIYMRILHVCKFLNMLVLSQSPDITLHEDLLWCTVAQFIELGIKKLFTHWSWNKGYHRYRKVCFIPLPTPRNWQWGPVKNEATEQMVSLGEAEVITSNALRSPPWHGGPLWNICVTNDHGYIPLFVNTSWSFLTHDLSSGL